MTPVLTGLPSPADLAGIPEDCLYVIPRGLVVGSFAASLVQSGHALPLLGDGQAFTAVELVIRREDTVNRCASSVTAFNPWLRVLKTTQREKLTDSLDTLGRVRKPFASLAMNKPKIMGIVNVTPDSFSDGGDFASHEAAIAHGLKLAGEGADILDVGGESTRPGAQPVDPDEECRRVIPVVKALAEKECLVSVDTRHASTMATAIEAGASIVNDVTALQGDPNAVAVVAKHETPVILMHMQGEPRGMQTDPAYAWAPIDVYDELRGRIIACEAAGIDRSSICIDPGIGFGKTLTHNVDLIESLALLHDLGCAVMIGASRKRFIGELADISDPKNRGPGSIAVTVKTVEQGVQIVRVHDVAETRQAMAVARVIEWSNDS